MQTKNSVAIDDAIECEKAKGPDDNMSRWGNFLWDLLYPFCTVPAVMRGKRGYLPNGNFGPAIPDGIPTNAVKEGFPRGRRVVKSVSRRTCVMDLSQDGVLHWW